MLVPALALSLLLPTAVDDNAARLLTEVVTAALGKDARLDVVASSDMRRQLDLEAGRQMAGCASDQSCLAEIANALGARFVVYGTLGSLDDVVVLTLNLFDSDAGSAVGRVVVKDKGLSALSERVEPAVAELTARLPASASPQQRPRVLVLDIAAPSSPSSSSSSSSSSPSVPLTVIGGVAGVGLGVIGGIGAALALFAAKGEDDLADDKALDATAAAQHYDARDGYTVLTFVAAGAGALALAGGGALLFLPSGDESVEVAQ